MANHNSSAAAGVAITPRGPRPAHLAAWSATECEESEKSSGSRTSAAHEDDRAALLLPPSPPPPGAIRLLIARGCTWTVRDVPDATQVDVTLIPLAPRRRPRGGNSAGPGPIGGGSALLQGLVVPDRLALRSGRGLLGCRF